MACVFRRCCASKSCTVGVVFFWAVWHFQKLQLQYLWSFRCQRGLILTGEKDRERAHDRTKGSRLAGE